MRLSSSAAVFGLFAAPAMAATLIGPTPYLSVVDSPFLGSLGFTLEDFEDGLFNIPGVSANVGAPFGPGGSTDSVDADDGLIDGIGTNGRSYHYADAIAGIRFTFDEIVLGTLPTRAGLVWTDGNNSIVFEAFDRNGVSLGILVGSHGDGSYFGTTGDDRFYGVEYAAGIGSIHIRSTGGGGIEVDHLQYGWIPTPGALGVLGMGVLAASRRRRS